MRCSQNAPWTNFRLCRAAIFGHHLRSARPGSGAWATGATVPCDTDVALLGGEALAWRWGRELGVRLTEHRFIEADDLAAELRLIKSEAELDLLRSAGEIGTRAVDAAMEAAVPEITEAEVAAAAISEIVRSGGALYGWDSPRGRGLTRLAPPPPPLTADGAWTRAT
jgi:Xaa-Pro aminopeptidase